jgi:hypothetical protein
MTDGERIDVAFSYIEGPKVRDWTQNFHDTYYKSRTERWDVTWSQFKQALNSQFLDKNEEDMAQEEFERIRQRPGEKAADFFTRFETCLNIAKYNKESNFVVKRLERIINPKIIDQIFGSNQKLPRGYDQWKDAIIDIDEMWSRRGESKKAWGSGWNNWFGNGQPRQNTSILTPPVRATWSPPQQSQPKTIQTDRRDGSGTTFGGTGRPMDLDKARSEGRCFRCGEKGHISKFCPNKKTVIRTVEVDLESNDRGPTSSVTNIRQMFSNLDNEERAALAKELGFVLALQ